MAKSRKGWYDREEIQKVTLDWLKTNRRPTERELELLRIVKERKLVRRDHLEVICEPYRIIGESRTRIINRSIERLFSTMYLDKTHEKQEIGKGNLPCVVSLDRAGSLFFGIPHKPRITQNKRIIKDREYIFRSLPNYFRHTHGINQVEVDTIELGHEIVQWAHEKGVEFHRGVEKVKVIPDVFIELKIRQKPFWAFLEYDTGTENARSTKSFPILDKKISNYRMYKQTEMWKQYSGYFPVILFVTEDDKRVEYFTRECKKNGLQGWGIYHDRYKVFMEHLATLV